MKISIKSVLPAILIIVTSGCYPGQTRFINSFPKLKIKSSDIYVMDPLVESREQTSEKTFDVDYSTLRLTDSLMNLALKNILKNYPVTYDDSQLLLTQPTRSVLDSILLKFKSGKTESISIKHDLNFPRKFKYTLVPHLVWTRTIKNYEPEKKCRQYYRTRYFGEHYRSVNCTWTTLEVSVFLIENLTQDVKYFKTNAWQITEISLPYYSRIRRSFHEASVDLIRQLNDY